MNAIYLDAQAVRQRVERLKLDFPELAEDAGLLGDMVEGETDLHAVLSRLVDQERGSAAMVAAVKEREADLAARRARFEKQQQLARSLILSLLDIAEQRKVTLPEATLSVSQAPPQVVVECDPEALPEEYQRLTVSADKMALKEAFAAGKTVPGAHLTNGGVRLTVRVK